MDYYQRKSGVVAPRTDLNEFELKELSIVKQAFIKSLIESGQIKELTKEAEKIVEDWVKYIRRNGEREYKLWKEQDKPF